MRWLPLLLASVTASAASLPPSTGRDGALIVTGSNTIINKTGSISVDAPASATSVQVLGGLFSAGDLVLVLHNTTTAVSPDAGTTALDLASSSVGTWFTTRVVSFSDPTLTLADPLPTACAASECQVMRVPEYTSVVISSAGSLVPPPWDGKVGGVLVFAASDVTNDGLISADGAGFRGGVGVTDVPATMGCTNLNLPVPVGGMKAEGLLSAVYPGTEGGRGNRANAGGGGDCREAGGGGGGHGGRGGRGGFSFDTHGDVGGMPGVSVTSAGGRLLFGGGGGAGQTPYNDVGSSGGAGGGVVFIGALNIVGSGRISANGSSGRLNVPSATTGVGGGGAGGTVSLQSQVIAGVLISATGGAGERVEGFGNGPGGGGGGGRILIDAVTFTGSTNVAAGTAGLHGASGFNGAEPDDLSVLLAPFVGEVTISLTVVDAGVVDAGVVDAGVVDAGAVDAGAVDAGAVDAGAVDAGVVDAGVVDAGVVDAGVVVDGGTMESPLPQVLAVGCGCNTFDGLSAVFAMLMVLHFSSKSRRRRG